MNKQEREINDRIESLESESGIKVSDKPKSIINRVNFVESKVINLNKIKRLERDIEDKDIGENYKKSVVDYLTKVFERVPTEFEICLHLSNRAKVQIVKTYGSYTGYLKEEKEKFGTVFEKLDV